MTHLNCGPPISFSTLQCHQHLYYFPFSTWDKELHKIVFDPRYLLLNPKERKQVFDQYVKTRAEEERKEKKNKLMQAKDEFRRMMEEAKLTPRTTFSEFAVKHGRDPRFKTIEKLKNSGRLSSLSKVADRLFSSFGQDILDALYWTATEPKERKRDSIGVIPHFFMAVFYVFLHAILIMVQASTLNVAFNSHNKSLLTIMMSNNFVEIKGSVFKKFEKNNLFQMSNSDIKERFTSYVLLLIVCLRNMEQFSWNPDHLWVLFPDVFMVVTSEIAVDIIKHAFITKFNDITADVYSEYRASLAFDLVSSRQKNACTDYSDSVARRMGFIPLPLAVLLIRVVMSSVKVQGALSYSCLFLFYLGLVTLKVLNSIVLLGKSCVYVKRANMEDKLFERPAPTTSSSAKSPSKADPARCSTPSGKPDTTTYQSGKEGETQAASEMKHRTPKKDLLEIDRFTICGNRID
uniref:Transmembrane anterior posterior transformation 1 n=1 Tax=Amphiprion percula TaxID=161767 RepID=A0A3P8S1F2_AMPPE